MIQSAFGFGVFLILFTSISLSATEKKGDSIMDKYSEIKIITLGKTKVASYQFQYSTSPEGQAAGKIQKFAKDNGLFKNKPCFYGFDNPSPGRSPKKPEYGYESWVTVTDDIKGNNGVKIKEIELGEYLAMYGVNMDEAWAWIKSEINGFNYNEWTKTSGYEYDVSRQWLDWVIYDESKYPEYAMKTIMLLFPMKKKSEEAKK